MYRTFKDNDGHMEEVTPVYMTHDEHMAYASWLNGDHVSEAVDYDPVLLDKILNFDLDDKLDGLNIRPKAQVKPRKGYSKRHYTNPRNPSMYTLGTARLSAERMDDVRDALETHATDKAAAKALNIKVNTLQSYKSMAKHYGLI